ncbi:MAG TPA: hypothetical protein PLF78_04875 [Caulobacter sp.]|nr:hypothetical protein [Caulobacter sp.]
MIQHLSLLNPFGRIDDRERATAAARGGAVALAIGALISLYGAAKLYLMPAALTEAMRAGMAGSASTNPDAAKVAEAMIPGVMQMAAMMSIGIAVVLLILAVVQWRRLTRVIPLIFACLGALGLVMAALGMVMIASGMTPSPPVPLAETVITRALSLVTLVLHIGAYRGADWLAKAT